jgi:hypothetical protein
MKPRNSLVLLFLGALALAAGFFVQENREQAAITTSATGQLAFPDLASRIASVARIEIADHTKTLQLTRAGDRWVLPEHGDFPALAARAHALLAALTELRLVEARTSNPADFARLGLTAPDEPKSEAKQVRLLDDKGQVLAALLIGHTRPSPEPGGTDQVFVRLQGQNQTWLAAATIDADPDFGGWIARDIVNIGHDQVTGITIDRLPNDHLVLTRQGDKLVVTVPAEHPVLDQFKIDGMARGLEFLSFTDARKADAAPGQKRGHVAFTTADGLTLAADVSEEGNNTWAVLTATGKDKAAAQATELNRKFSGFALAIPSWQGKTLLPTLNDLKPPEKPATPPISVAPEAPGSEAPESPAMPPMPGK